MSEKTTEKKIMPVLLIGDDRYEKIRQKLEFHLPMNGYSTTSIQFLRNLEEDGKDDQVDTLLDKVQLAVVITNETGFLGDQAIEYIDYCLGDDIPTTSLAVLKDYPDVSITEMANAVKGIFNLETSPVTETKETGATKEAGTIKEELKQEAATFFQEHGTEEVTAEEPAVTSEEE